MNHFMPITLTEDTLGRRHRQLNDLVKKAFVSGVPFQNVECVVDKSPVDRLFKIDLASKLKNVDYILQNIKDEDLLYVSRALKSKWLLDSEYQHIINPVYLEKELFPHMVTTAISKTKNWLYVHLKDSQRCQEFYKYYAEKDNTYSIKFLNGCDIAFILNEVENILDKLTPHQLKVLCEKSPKVAEIYFRNIAVNDKLKDIFLNKEYEYFESLKVVLKRDPDIFFNISEKYFDKKFNRSLTKHILKYHKHIFNRKLELYVTRSLNMDAVAHYLNPEECKDIIIQLARAKYLSNWFSYKNVEPLMKRISVYERAEFKKRVFVNKDVGEEIEEWPYELPALPGKENMFYVFDDIDHNPYEYEFLDKKRFKKMIKKRSRNKCEDVFIRSEYDGIKTYLDKLYDEYRFISFGQTLFELRRRLKVESLPQNREYMLLVLVSKSGGKMDNLASLLELLSQHSNEPVHIRAAIVRSLVKRAAVWRVNKEIWDAFLQFGQGLGLDGSKLECVCYEGIHAVVLRHLLEKNTCEPELRDCFIEHFSSFAEYSINGNEKSILRKHLPLLIESAIEAETNTEKQAELLELLLNTLEAYKVPLDSSPVIPITKSLAKRDFPAAQNILERLFSAKIARRTLFYENFSFIQTDASYLNVLRHDTSILDANVFLHLIMEEKLCPKNFLLKIAIYFSESGGLMQNYLVQMKEKVLTLTRPNKKLAKCLCFLLDDIEYILGFNLEEKYFKRFAADLRANMHISRIQFDISQIDFSVVGAKALANKVFICPEKDVGNYVKILLNWKRSVRVGVVLSQRVSKEADAFAIAASIRPMSILKTAIKYFRRRGDSIDVRVWDVIKPILKDIDISLHNRRYLRDFISEVKTIPSYIRLEYCIILYKCFINNFYYKALSILCHIELQFPNVCEEFIENVVTDFLNEMNTDKYAIMENKCMLIYVRVVIKYLLVAKSEDVQKQRFRVYGEKFLNKLETLRNNNSYLFDIIFEEVMLTLQNNKIFFDMTLISPLLIIEFFVSWMRTHLPIELHFRKYVHVHLIMLYCKAIRQCVKQMPQIFSDEKRKANEGIDIIGRTFGKYTANELKILMSNYFKSITEIYKIPFSEYLNMYFGWDCSPSRFKVAVIEGILDNSVGTEAKIGIYLLKDHWYEIETELRNKLLNKMKNIEELEVKFTLFAEL